MDKVAENKYVVVLDMRDMDVFITMLNEKHSHYGKVGKVIAMIVDENIVPSSVYYQVVYSGNDITFVNVNHYKTYKIWGD